MLFNSLEFIFVFLPIVWMFFHALAQYNARWAISFLGFASIGFYAWWDYRFIGILLVSILFNYRCGVELIRTEGVNKRGVLIFGVVFNLLLLAYFKYANFFLASLASLISVDAPVLDVVLPLGISFFTFTQIAFLVDVYSGIAKEYRFTNYLLFVTYFPHLIAGPILHHKEMMPQFEKVGPASLDADSIARGLSIFAFGLAKKVLIADQLSAIATPIFALANQSPLSFLEAWGGALAYTLQLYFDFSGYCDMAIGVSVMFGIKIPVNFNSPYKARSIIDFWQRWHMTLSRFLRDYLYIPLGGNRRGAGRRYLNLAVTMLLGGLWHGASWTFVFWGALHGSFLMINHGWRSLSVSRALQGSRVWRGIAQTLTFVCVVVAWVYFRAESFGAATNIVEAMAGGGKGLIVPDLCRDMAPSLFGLFEYSQGLGFMLPVHWGPVHSAVRAALWIPPLLLVVFWLPNTQDIFGGNKIALCGKDNSILAPESSVFAWRPSFYWAIGCGIVAVWAIVTMHRASEFLYYQF